MPEPVIRHPWFAERYAAATTDHERMGIAWSYLLASIKDCVTEDQRAPIRREATDALIRAAQR